MALNRIAIPSPNYSSRGGTAVRLVVIHTAEGSRTIESLGSWFQNPASGVSSHTGADDKVNTVGEYVPPGYKAWTQANANPYSVAIEMCGFASWSAAEWHAHPNMLANTAAWIAEECARFGIPLRALNASQAQGGQAGVCDHAALGSLGGGHWDIGSGISVAELVAMAQGGAPAPAPKKNRSHNMIASTSTGKGYWTVSHDGAVGAFGDAQYKGGGFSPDIINGECVGIAGKGNDGYWLFASDGGVFTFGSADFYGRPDRF